MKCTAFLKNNYQLVKLLICFRRLTNSTIVLLSLYINKIRCVQENFKAPGVINRKMNKRMFKYKEKA